MKRRKFFPSFLCFLYGFHYLCTMKRIVLLWMALMIVFTGKAQLGYLMQHPAPKHEVRGVWLTTLSGLDWPKTKALSAESRKKQQEELCRLLDQVQQCGINTVFFQTRIRGSVVYPSKIEPWDVALTGKYDKDPGYNPLAFAIEECHRRGMELHAWVVAVPCFKTAQARKIGKKSLINTHPKLLRRHDGQYYLDPGLPGSAEYVSSICKEIVSNYDVDGIHLDYIRYPERADGFSDGATYSKYGKKQNKADWRRANVTQMVRTIYNDVKKVKPWVRLSCSPVGKHADVSRYSARGWSAWGTVYQEAQAWLEQGIMDMLCPMMYFKDDHFFPFAADWQEQSHGRTIAPGLGIYFLHPKEKDWPLDVIQRQLAFMRSENLQGQAYFRCLHLTENTKGLYDYLQGEFYSHPALLPPMKWQDSVPPSKPELVERKRIKGTMEEISWKPQQKDGTYCRYAVYASQKRPVDVGDVRNLLTVTQNTAYTYNLLNATLYGMHLAVTAIDRYGNESEPLFIDGLSVKSESTHPWAKEMKKRSMIY